MANISISELSTEATSVNENDLFLISKASSDGTTFTSAKVKGNKIKKNSGYGLSENENTLSIDSNIIALQSDITALTQRIAYLESKVDPPTTRKILQYLQFTSWGSNVSYINSLFPVMGSTIDITFKIVAPVNFETKTYEHHGSAIYFACSLMRNTSTSESSLFLSSCGGRGIIMVDDCLYGHPGDIGCFSYSTSEKYTTITCDRGDNITDWNSFNNVSITHNGISAASTCSFNGGDSIPLKIATSGIGSWQVTNGTALIGAFPGITQGDINDVYGNDTVSIQISSITLKLNGDSRQIQLVPCSFNGNLCFYDSANNEYYYPEGTGMVAGGPEVA